MCFLCDEFGHTVPVSLRFRAVSEGELSSSKMFLIRRDNSANLLTTA